MTKIMVGVMIIASLRSLPMGQETTKKSLAISHPLKRMIHGEIKLVGATPIKRRGKYPYLSLFSSLPNLAFTYYFSFSFKEREGWTSSDNENKSNNTWGGSWGSSGEQNSSSENDRTPKSNNGGWNNSWGTDENNSSDSTSNYQKNYNSDSGWGSGNESGRGGYRGKHHSFHFI